MAVLVLFMHLLHLLSQLTSSKYLYTLSYVCPTSLYGARKLLGLLDDQFVEYVVCPSLFSSFAFERFHGVLGSYHTNRFFNQQAVHNLGIPIEFSGFKELLPLGSSNKGALLNSTCWRNGTETHLVIFTTTHSALIWISAMHQQKV